MAYLAGRNGSVRRRGGPAVERRGALMLPEGSGRLVEQREVKPQAERFCSTAGRS